MQGNINVSLIPWRSVYEPNEIISTVTGYGETTQGTTVKSQSGPQNYASTPYPSFFFFFFFGPFTAVHTIARSLGKFFFNFSKINKITKWMIRNDLIKEINLLSSWTFAEAW